MDLAAVSINGLIAMSAAYKLLDGQLSTSRSIQVKPSGS